MKLKLDENLPAGLVAALAELGHDVDSVPMEGLKGSDDPGVWNAAQREERFFITQDLDFSDLRVFLPGAHCGILLVRLRDPSRLALIDHLVAIFQPEEVATWTGCFVVTTERKLRTRRPLPPSVDP